MAWKTTVALAAACLVPVLAQAADAPEWKLVWSDEFEKDGLPDPAKWNYETGFVRNKEQQYYTRARPENARIEKGMLVLEARKEAFPLPDGSGSASYTAASLTTRNKASWTYGRIEARAKVPQGKGVWPALWTLGTQIGEVGWPRCGEIDIMEFVGKEPERIHGTVHFLSSGKHRANGNKVKALAPYEDFHLYAVEWTAQQITFLYDGVPYHTFQMDSAGSGPENPFRKPHYLLVNFALGGSWGGKIDDSVLPQRYLVDYIRVYQDSGGAPPPASP
jgi:beta-glucanase (GH16 family)